MALPTECKQLLLQQRPSGYPDPSLGSETSTFKLFTKQLPSTLPQGSALLATRFLSNDPAQRAWISAAIEPERLYVPPVEVGAPMRSRDIFEVIQSAADSLAVGSLVTVTDPGNNQTGWVSHLIIAAEKCTVLPPLPNDLSPTHYLGALGATGLTAYYGLTEIVQAKAEDVVVISGAAGATGSLAVQIAKKILGCRRVVGIAGGASKCDWVRSIGADACVDYKAASFHDDLAAATKDQDQPSVYFDNVGGETLDFMLTRMARYGRIAICGAISTYNSAGKDQPFSNWTEVISSRLVIKGFIVVDYFHRAKEVQAILRQAIEEGKIKLDGQSQTVVKTAFEDIPKTWMMLFSGGNVGKLVTQLL